VDVCGQCLHVVCAQAGRWEPIFVRPLQDWLNQFTFAIIQDNRCAQQIGTSLLAAAKVGAVAPATFRIVNRSAARDDRRVRRVTLLRRKARDTSAPLAECGRRAEHDECGQQHERRSTVDLRPSTCNC
jgi:hypothetical protein